jgi:hypothetical protein
MSRSQLSGRNRSVVAGLSLTTALLASAAGAQGAPPVTHKTLTFLHEVAHNIRRIWLDRQHPEHLTHTFLGDSIGHWEGDTLVVDTVGLNDRTFIDDEGSSHSTQLHTIEHFRKLEAGAKLEMIMTVEDPVTLEHPYSYRRIYAWRPDVRPQEYVCEENNRNAPVDGVTVAK